MVHSQLARAEYSVSFKMLHKGILIVALAMTVSASKCGLNPSTYTFNFGDAKGIVVSDGPSIVEDNFFSVPEAAVERSYRENFRATNPLIWGLNVLVLDTNVGRIMMDVGAFNTEAFTSFREAGLLRQNLRAAGVAPESIDAILLTHAHPDHVGGLTKLDGSAAFPNATVYISRVDHDFWSANPVPNPNPSIPEDAVGAIRDVFVRNVAPYEEAGRLRLVRENGRPLRGFRFIPTSGHSPGHSSIEFTSQGKRLIFTGDVFVTKADQLQNPEWGFFVETNRVQAFRSRISFLNRAARNDDLLVSYHEQFPGLGFVRKMGPFFDWAPAEPQLLGAGVIRQC